MERRLRGDARGGVEKYLRDAAVYLHTDATADVANFKIAKALFPATAGPYAGPA